MSNGVTQTQIQRRPEYLETIEKGLLDAIFGTPTEDESGATTYLGGLLQRRAPLPTTEDGQLTSLFEVAPYQLAGQIGRDPETGEITGLGPETYATQAVSEDLNNDGIPDFLGRYTPYFETAGAAATGGIESLRRGIGSLGDAKAFFGPATQYVSGGRGMYDPSDYVTSYMNPYTEEVLDEVEKDIERQGSVARQRGAAQAVQSGAFGGSRQGVQSAEIEKSILDAKAKAAADLRSRAYESALGSSLGAYKDAATRNLEAGRLMGGLGQSVGQIGTQFGQLGGQYGSLAGTTADIGRVYSALAPADLAFMSGVGADERAYRQQMIDTARREFQRPTEQALLPFTYGYGALSGTPSASLYSQTQQTYAPAANPFLSGLGAYTALQGINQQS